MILNLPDFIRRARTPQVSIAELANFSNEAERGSLQGDLRIESQNASPAFCTIRHWLTGKRKIRLVIAE